MFPQASVLRAQYMKNQENQVIAGVQLLSIAADTVKKALEKVTFIDFVFIFVLI